MHDVIAVLLILYQNAVLLALHHCCADHLASLSQYVSEAVSALAEVPLKTLDIPVALDMAAALHLRCDAAAYCRTAS